MVSRDANDLHRPLRERWEYLRSMWRKSHPRGPDVQLSCTYRDKEAQDEAFRAGKSHARYGQSLHNYQPAYAFDVFFVDNEGAADWSWPLYEEFGTMAKQVGLVWGGDWARLKDGPHIQMPMTWVDAAEDRVPELPPLPVEEYGWKLVVYLESNVQQTIDLPEGYDIVTRVDPGRKRVWVDIKADG